MSDIMIETRELCRTFGEIRAVDGISFQVRRGEVLGFLGPNGAGKSTTMKMLTCFLAPSSGTAIVGGFDILEQSRQVRQLIGYLPENAPLYGEMTVEAFLRFVAQVRGLATAESSRAIDRVSDLCSLSLVRSQRVETLSKGFRRRVGLAQALLTDPDILILDEPTDGLDPNQKHEVRALINSMAQTKCIILSTHILEEVDAVCTRAIIIANGKLVADERPEDLKRRSKLYGAVTICFDEAPSDKFLEDLRAVPGVKEIQKERLAGSRTEYVVLPREDGALLSNLVSAAESNNWHFSELKTESGQLDEVFREITQ